MALKQITLELARDHDFPRGSREHGYRFTAPVDQDGKIEPDGWLAHRDQCRVIRFWAGEDDEIGHLVRKPGGSWAFHYDLLGDEDDDEVGYRFDGHTFRPGEYISIREHDDVLRTFKVITVSDIG